MYAAAASPFSVGSISAGALLGTTGTSELVRSINGSLGGSSLIGAAHDTFQELRANFIQNVIQPIQMGRAAVMQRVNVLMNPDIIRPLVDDVDFTSVPPCMYESIIMFAPLRALLDQGRISGFGFDPEHLPKEDTWGRLIDNGTCYDALNQRDADGKIWLTWEFRSTDPTASSEELDAVEITRQNIERILNNTTFDPTDYPEERG